MKFINIRPLSPAIVTSITIAPNDCPFAIDRASSTLSAVTVGGVPCNVSYAGAAPYLISGLTQINVQVPAGVTPGPSVPLVVTVGGVRAQNGVTLAVRADRPPGL